MLDPMVTIVFAASALLMTAGGFVWRFRARASRRKAALDAYADREIMRAAARSGRPHA
jgi:hypothetical protein